MLVGWCDGGLAVAVVGKLAGWCQWYDMGLGCFV